MPSNVGLFCSLLGLFCLYSRSLLTLPSELQLEMARQTSDIQRLEQTRSRLESDLKDKADALSLEQECEALQMDLTGRMK